MHLNNFKRLAPLIAPSLKLAGCFGVALVTGAYVQDNLVNELVSAPEGQVAVVKSALDLIKGLGGGEISGTTKELIEKYYLTINGDFEKAFHSAIEQTVSKLEKGYLDDNKLTKEEEQNVISFCAELRSTLIETPVGEADVERFILNRKHFLHTTPNLSNFDAPDENISNDFFKFIENEFGTVLQHELLQQLKANPKAETAYVISLLDLNVRYGHDNVDTLKRVELCLYELTNRITLINSQANKVVSLLLHIQENLHKQGLNQRILYERILEELRKSDQQPKLYDYKIYRKNQNKADRYHYRTAYTKFIGRHKEVSELQTFILPDPLYKFRWWSVIGHGGSGKSRLLQEVCLDFNKLGTYYSGFLAEEELNKDRLPFWQCWQPKCNTVIVIDYVSTRAEDIHALIRILTNRTNELDFSVRLILLERNIEGAWWQIINTNETRLFYHLKRPLLLSKLTEEELWNIVKETYNKVSLDPVHYQKSASTKLADKNQTIKRMKTLDEFGRPLFAIFVASAMSEGNSVRDWNVHRLVSNLIKEHEQKHWWKGEITQKDKNSYERLLALATIIHRVTLSEWKLISKHIVGLPDPYNYDIDLLTRIGQFTVQSPSIKPLNPDILGSFFVAQVLDRWLTFYDDEENVSNFITFCWKINGPNTTSFVERLYFDVGNAKCLPLFWKSLPTDAKIESVVAWVSLLESLTRKYYSKNWNEVHNPITFYSCIVDARKGGEASLNVHIARIQIRAAFNLVEYCRDKYPDQAASYYQEVIDISLTKEFLQNLHITSDRFYAMAMKAKLLKHL